MASPKGNKFWEMRSTHGRKPKFSNPDDLWSAACEYFEWVEANPLQEEKIFHAQGIITKATVDKMRAMTIQGLCLFLDIDEQTLTNYEKKQDFFGIVSHIKKVIYTQKIEGAAADLLNSNIIAREVGLTDKKDHTSSDGSMSPDGLTSEQRKNRISELLNKNSNK